MTFNTLTLPGWDPYITKMELKSGSKENYDFEGMFKEIWFDTQVRTCLYNLLVNIPKYYTYLLRHLLFSVNL